MITKSSVCADSSVLVKLALPEDNSVIAEQLWDSWDRGNIAVFAPRLIKYEFISVLRQATRRGRTSRDTADEAIEKLLNLPITLIDSEELHNVAYDLANDLDMASAYDAHYLALALALDCEFWTADHQLFSSVSDRFPLVRLLGS